MPDPQRRAARAPSAPRGVPRRTALGAIAALAGPPAVGRAQQGGDWPSQPVRYVNIFPPGGATDTGSLKS